MASKPETMQSAVHNNIRWDFSEVADTLERLRMKHAPTTRHNAHNPLAWLLRAPALTGLGDEGDGKRPISRAFEACGIVTDVEIGKLAGYSSSSSVSRWDVRRMDPGTVQERVFPALCDAYCKAREQHPNPHSHTFVAGAESPYLSDESLAGEMKDEIRFSRIAIEEEVAWVLVRGVLDALPGIAKDNYIVSRDGYRRAVALYAGMFLGGGELGDLAHVAAALVAQHLAAHENTDWGEHDPICLSKVQNDLDFMADRYEPDEHGLSLHAIVSAEELARMSDDLGRAMLRYADTRFLQASEQAIRAELERRSKIGCSYYAPLHAEAEPSDEDRPST